MARHRRGDRIGDRARAQLQEYRGPVPRLGFPLDDVDVTIHDYFNQPRGHGPHKGVDIPAAGGTLVRAAQGGRVEFASVQGHPSQAEGYQVRIRDGYGFTHSYFHLRHAPSVATNDVVPTLAIIGAVGSTGRSDGPHLHYQLQAPNGEWVDPYPHLILAQRSEEAASPEAAEGVGDAAQDAARARWNARNTLVTEYVEDARAFVWPTVILDETDEGSEARLQLRAAREAYQRAQETWLRAYRARRDRGQETEAQAVVDRMRQTRTGWRESVYQLQRIYSRTFVENLAHGISDTEAAAMAALASVGTAVSSASAGIGAGLGLVLLGAAWWFMGRGGGGGSR